MAISTDAAIEFFGTQDSIDDGSTSTISSTSFSAAADITAWTNDDDAPLAAIIFRWQYASGTITAGANIAIFARALNTQSTNDANTPDASFPHKLIGTIPVDEGLATTTNEYTVPVIVKLPNTYTSSQFEFYFQNNTGVSISAGWAAWITPLTLGPHA